MSQQKETAFEYVAGTLKAKERTEYEALLSTSSEQQALVKFWQEQLLAFDIRAGERPPAADTWSKISKAIGRSEETTLPTSNLTNRQNPFFASWFAWLSASMATLLLAFILVNPYINPPSDKPNTDYIAVLTDEEGNAVLTALTTAKDQALWLQWEPGSIYVQQTVAGLPKEISMQLWAVSKRDGQVRSLAIFDDIKNKMELNETHFRLITDSSFLLLTREEPGGSPIDEPSEHLIAKGVCVRFGGDEA